MRVHPFNYDQLWVSLKTGHPQVLEAAAVQGIHGNILGAQGRTQGLAAQAAQAGPKARLQLLTAVEEGIWHQLLKTIAKSGKKYRKMTNTVWYCMTLYDTVSGTKWKEGGKVKI